LRVNITARESQIEAIDRIAGAAGMTLSAMSCGKRGWPGRGQEVRK
jgi:hypothetical protein